MNDGGDRSRDHNQEDTTNNDPPQNSGSTNESDVEDTTQPPRPIVAQRRSSIVDAVQRSRWDEMTDYLRSRNEAVRSTRDQGIITGRRESAVGDMFYPARSELTEEREANVVREVPRTTPAPIDDKKRAKKIVRFTKGNIWDEENRSEVIRSLCVVSLTIVVLVGLASTLTVLLYGVTWNPSRFYKRLSVTILNQDNSSTLAPPPPPVLDGIPSFSQLLVDSILSTNAYDFSVTTAIDDPELYVIRGYTFAVIQIPQGFSSKLTAGLNGDNTSYDPSQNAIVNIFNEGAGFSIVSQIRQTIRTVVTNLSVNVTQQLLTADPSIATRASIPALSQPYYLQDFNIHPLGSPGREVLSGLGFIYLFIIATGLVNASIGGWGALMLKVKLWQMLIIRTIQAVIGSALVALAVVTIIICFGSASAFQRGWALYFLFLWLVELTFLFAGALIIHLFGPYANFVIPVFLFLNYTSSGGAVLLVVAPRFYRIGYGLPMFNAVQGARYIVLGSGRRIGLNVGVLVAWLLTCMVLSWIVQYFKLNLLLFKATPQAAQEAFEDVGNTVFTSNTTILASTGEEVQSSEMRARKSIDEQIKKNQQQAALIQTVPRIPPPSMTTVNTIAGQQPEQQGSIPNTPYPANNS